MVSLLYDNDSNSYGSKSIVIEMSHPPSPLWRSCAAPDTREGMGFRVHRKYSFMSGHKSSEDQILNLSTLKWQIYMQISAVYLYTLVLWACRCVRCTPCVNLVKRCVLQRCQVHKDNPPDLDQSLFRSQRPSVGKRLQRALCRSSARAVARLHSVTARECQHGLCENRGPMDSHTAENISQLGQRAAHSW